MIFKIHTHMIYLTLLLSFLGLVPRLFTSSYINVGFHTSIDMDNVFVDIR